MLFYLHYCSKICGHSSLLQFLKEVSNSAKLQLFDQKYSKQYYYDNIITVLNDCFIF